MLPARSRSLFSLAFIVACLILGAAMYLEYQVGLYPCSLYVLQRFFVIAFGLVCLAAAVHGPGIRGLRGYAAASLLMAIGGGLAATRQLWLQSRVAADPGCLSDLPCDWPTPPIAHFFQSLFLGTAECSRVNWSLLDMTWPEWSLLTFVAMGVFALLQLFQRSRPRAVAS
jgi:disulfide bond formation protein DsbB